jgi:AcrR family transcriptional regulator
MVTVDAHSVDAHSGCQTYSQTHSGCQTHAGRRARNKERTRDALLEASRDLFAEQGVAATTVASIAEAAEVSERTFFRYFAAKEDLLLPGVHRLLADIERELQARPAHETSLTAIRNAVTAVVVASHGTGQPRLLPAGIDQPTVEALAGRLSVVALNWERRLGSLLAQRLRAGGSTESEHAVALRAAVIATAVTSACRAALRLNRERPVPGVTVADLLTATFDLLEAGLDV